MPGKVRVSSSLGPLTADLPCVLCSYSYMIDNVILLITGTLHQRSITELVPKCHPLGSFEQMEAVNIAQTPAELYNAILVDTPLGEPCWGGGTGISPQASCYSNGDYLPPSPSTPVPPAQWVPKAELEPGESRRGGLASGKPQLQTTVLESSEHARQAASGRMQVCVRGQERKVLWELPLGLT